MFIGAGLSSLFSQLKILQLAVYTMGFHLSFPLNLRELNTIFLGMATFDLLPTQEIIDAITTYSETEAPSDGLKALGFESQNFLLNGGTLFIILGSQLCVLALAKLVMLCQKIRQSRRLHTCASWLERQVVWSPFLDLLMTAQVELLLSATVQLRKWTWVEHGDRIACIASLGIVLLYMALPIVLFKVLRLIWARKAFETKEYKARFGILTEGLRIKTWQHLAYQFVGIARRLCLIFLLFSDNLTA